MEKDNLTKLIDHLLEENAELKDKVRQLEAELAIAKLDKNIPINPVTTPQITWDKQDKPTGPTDIYGNPVPYCSTSI